METSMLYKHYNGIAVNLTWSWKNFTPKEMACKHCGELKIVPVFMDNLQALRDMTGQLPINSGYRCPEYDREIGGAGVHPTGMAVDIGIAGVLAFLLLSRVFKGPIFTGIGIRQKGPWSGRFIHLDTLPEGVEAHPRPRIWTYDAG